MPDAKSVGDLTSLITSDNLNAAFHAFHNLVTLGASPLAGLASVRSRQSQIEAEQASLPRPTIPTHQLRGAALAAELKALINSLEPSDPALSASHNRRHPYEILHQTVILGRSATIVAGRLFISRSQFYRIREKAVSDLVAVWRQREEQYSLPVELTEVASNATELVESPPEQNQPLAPANNLSSGFRVVSLLVAQLSGFAQAAASLDPEDTHVLLDHLLSHLAAPLEAQGGYILQAGERGLLAAFGAPVSREDDPQRAVQSGLSLLTAMPTAQRAWRGPDIAAWPIVRLVISTGRVFAGPLGTGNNQQYSVTGAALETAQALAEIAPPGLVVVEQNTFERVRGLFAVEKVYRPDQGEGGPIYQVIGPRPPGQTSEMRGVQGVETEMIGRGPEWDLLRRSYTECVEQDSVRQLTIVGSAGSGKSRLEDEFRRWVELESPPPNYWRGQVSQEARPYEPFITMLAKLANFAPDDIGETKREKLLQLCRDKLSGPGELSELTRADEVAHLLAMLMEVGWPGSSVVAALEKRPAQAQLATFKAFRDLCQSAANRVPLLLVIEDLHWAAEATLSLWQYLASELPELPVLLIGLSRPDLYERKPEWGIDLDRHNRLDLKPLTPPRCRELVRHILRKLPDPPDTLVQQIAEAAEGNPFFVEEIIKALLDERVIERDEADNWRLNNLPDVLPTPPTIEGLIQARLDRLPGQQRVILEVAAISGRSFTPAMLTALVPTASQLDRTLLKLQQTEWLARRVSAESENTYTFKHSLLREVIYAQLPRLRRLNWHRQLAEWLEQAYLEDPDGGASAARLAEQFERAEQASQAALYYEIAAGIARASFALTEAIAAYRAALQGVDSAKESERAGRLRVELARLHFLQADYTAAASELATAQNLLSLEQPEWLDSQLLRAEISERRGDYDQGIEECLDALQDWDIYRRTHPLQDNGGISAALIKTQLGSLFFRRSRYQEAREVLEQARADLQNTASPRERQALADTYKNLALVYWAQSSLAEAQTAVESGLLGYQELKDWNGQAACYDILGLIRRDSGQLDQANEFYQKAHNLFEKIGDRQRATYTLVNQGVVCWYKGEYDKAESFYRTALAVYQSIGGRFGVAACNNRLGQLERERGNLTAARDLIEGGLEVFVALGDDRSTASSLYDLAKVAYLRADYATARELVKTSYDIRQRIEHQPGMADCRILLGWLDYQENNRDTALSAFVEALENCQRINYVYGQAQAQIGLGALAWQRAAHASAHLLFSTAQALAAAYSFYEPHRTATEWLEKF